MSLEKWSNLYLTESKYSIEVCALALNLHLLAFTCGSVILLSYVAYSFLHHLSATIFIILWLLLLLPWLTVSGSLRLVKAQTKAKTKTKAKVNAKTTHRQWAFFPQYFELQPNYVFSIDNEGRIAMAGLKGQLSPESKISFFGVHLFMKAQQDINAEVENMPLCQKPVAVARYIPKKLLSAQDLARLARIIKHHATA